MSLQGFELPFIKILRMLRVLRPLRFISRNVGLRMIVVALLDSVAFFQSELVMEREGSGGGGGRGSSSGWRGG